MNSGFLITDAGLAAATIATPTGPYIHITGFKVGSGVGYTPERDMLDLQGTLLYTGVASGYSIIDANTVEVLLVMDADVGPFNFGEIGLFLESGEMFALCVFDNLQEKIRAVGAQAGATWRIRARIILAQVPVLVQVDIINSQGILEVPNWQSLQKPVDQLMNANIAIVHEWNSSDEPILVIRDNDEEWGLVDFSRMLERDTDDVDALLTVNTWRHPGISSLYFEDMPRTDSKYVIKFPDGSLRKVTSQIDQFTVGFAPDVAVSVGKVGLFQEGGAGHRISWADTFEHNQYADLFNPYWFDPIGPYRAAGPSNVPYPASNKGLGQTAIATLTRRTNPNDWAILLAAVRANCQIHSVPITDLAAITDFVYRPIAPHFYGMEQLRLRWQSLLAVIPLLETNRNVFDLAFQDQILLTTSTQNGFWDGVKIFRHTLTYLSNPHLQALMNGGHEIRFNGNVTLILNGDWTELRDLFIALGTVRIVHNAVVAGVGTPTGVGMHELTNTAQDMWSYTAFNWTVTLTGRRPTGTFDIVFDLEIDNDATSPYVTPGDPGLITLEVYSRRPTSSLIDGPVLAHPAIAFTLPP